MLEINTDSEQTVITNSAQMPILMERYIAAVERVMSSYGLDPQKCQFERSH